jgi:hypothetical protein
MPVTHAAAVTPSAVSLLLPSLLDLLRWPLQLGYPHEHMLIGSFQHITPSWESRLQALLARHPTLATSIQEQVHATPTLHGIPLRNVTSRGGLNPTFIVHDVCIVKFFSPYNHRYGECDLATAALGIHHHHDSDMHPPPQPPSPSSSSSLSSHFSFPNLRFYDKARMKKTKKNVVHSLLLAPFEKERLIYEQYGLSSSTSLASLPPIKSTRSMDTKSSSMRMMMCKLLAAGVGPRDESTALGWRWPYIVLSYTPHCMSLSQHIRTYGGITSSSWKNLIQWLGLDWFPTFHGAPVSIYLSIHPSLSTYLHILYILYISLDPYDSYTIHDARLG